MSVIAEAAVSAPRDQVRFPHAGLVWTLVRTDFKARYHGTLGGFVWALLKPVCMFIVLMGVFSFLFAGNPTYKLNLIVALFLWEFFSEGTKSGLMSLHARGFLLSKTRVPIVDSCCDLDLERGDYSRGVLGRHRRVSHGCRSSPNR